jgi:hypothetical protein
MLPTRAVSFTLRLGLAATFAYAAIAKSAEVDNANVSPTIFADWSRSIVAGRIVVGTEALMALWLISGLESNVAGAVSLVVLSAFTGLILMELARDHPKPCGCMGPLAVLGPERVQLSLRLDLVRNGFMMIGAAWLYLVPRCDLTFRSLPEKYFARVVAIILRRAGETI